MVIKRVLGDSKKSLWHALKGHKTKMVRTCSSNARPLSAPKGIIFPGWRKSSGGQRMTWQKDMKKITEALSTVGVVRLTGWGPRDNSMVWLSTLMDMELNRSQWCKCCRMLTDSF